jgi:hypothetical protein
LLVQITVQVKGIKAVRESLKGLAADVRDRALAAGINKTAAKARTEIVRGITQEYAIGREEVSSALDTRLASAKREGKLTATLSVFGSARRKGRSFNAIRFLERTISYAEAKRRRKKGTLATVGKGGKLHPILGFKIRRAGGLKRIEGAFIGNAGRTVFVRTGDKRLPIKPVQVIGISQMFASKRVQPRVLGRIDRELPIEVDRAVKAVLRKFIK